MKIKSFSRDLNCENCQFEIGGIYDTGVADDMINFYDSSVFCYYDECLKGMFYIDNFSLRYVRYCEIEVLGAEITDGYRFGSNRIKIIREIVGDELLELHGWINGNTGNFNTGARNAGDNNTGFRNTGNRNDGHENSGKRNKGNQNTGSGNIGNQNTGWFNQGDKNTGRKNIGNSNTGEFNIGSYNTGFGNSCNYSNGVFCNCDDMNIRIFNKPSGMSLEEFYNSIYYKAITSVPSATTKFVEYTSDEKNNDEKIVLGGYLKPLSPKESYNTWWEKLTEENKKIIMQIPNFDAEIFFDITGIDVRKEDDN